MLRLLGQALALTTLIAIPAAAEVPARVPAERMAGKTDAEDFIVFLPAERTDEDAELVVVFAARDASPGSFLALRTTGDATELLQVREGVPEVVARRERGLPPQGEFELLVRRRGPQLIVSADGALLAHFFHDDREPGGTRIGAWAERGGIVSEVLVQPLGEIAFDEDFFETETVPQRWQTLHGAWQVGIYRDPLQERDDRPIGASWYEPGEGRCLCATGYQIWDSYRLETTARIEQGRGGLAFHVRGPNEYCAFEVGEGMARLVQVRGGEREVLAEAPVELRQAWWYRLRADIATGHARCFVNDRPLVEADLSPALIGRLGLCADGAAGSRFDDVAARSIHVARIPIEGTADALLHVEEGSWSIEEGVVHGHVRGAEVAALRLHVEGDRGISAQVDGTRDCTPGVVLAYRREEPKSALLFTVTAAEQPTWHLHRTDGDATEELASGAANAGPWKLSLRSVNGTVRCLIDGKQVHEAHLSGILWGRSGLYLQGGRGTFSGVTCRELSDEPQAIICRADGMNLPLPALEEKRTIRPIGNLWRPRSSSWRCASTDEGPAIIAKPRGDAAVARFHEVTPGEPRLIVDVARVPAEAQITLGLCAGEEPGYELELYPAENGYRLLRRGEVVHDTGEFSDGLVAPRPAELRRRGAWIIARGEERFSILAWRDPDPLPDGHAEVRVSGGEVQFREITLAGDSARAYRFDRVEPDWQPRSGTWTDHTGMACILWDYWMTGDGREEPALTWNRHEVPEDVAVDISAAEFTEGEETGHHQHFPYHDVSVILGGTPGDPDSGYRFIAGADGGRRTVLMREGVEVASSDDRRFRIVMGGHCNSPRAVRLRARRAGETLTLTVNGTEALRWTDPQPLAGGGHVGIGCEGCRTIFRDCVIYPGVRAA